MEGAITIDGASVQLKVRGASVPKKSLQSTSNSIQLK